MISLSKVRLSVLIAIQLQLNCLSPYQPIHPVLTSYDETEFEQRCPNDLQEYMY